MSSPTSAWAYPCTQRCDDLVFVKILMSGIALSTMGRFAMPSD